MNFTRQKTRVGASALLGAALLTPTHCTNFFEAAAGAPLAIITAPAKFPAGSSGRFLQLATVKNRWARVTVNGGASATVNGVTVSSLAVNEAGAARALVSTSCKATNAEFTLRATNGKGGAAPATLAVAVTPNPPPTLGYDGTQTVAPGGTLTIKPTSGLTDQGGVSAVTVRRVTPKFHGALSVDAQGVVTVGKAPAGGSFIRGLH